MSLDKAIEHNKEHRKQYYGGKKVDPSCRNHGGCPYCEGDRLHNFNIYEEKRQDMLQEYLINRANMTQEDNNNYEYDIESSDSNEN